MGYCQPLYEFALLVALPGENYEDACRNAKELAQGLADDIPSGVEAVLEYEYEGPGRLEGQRILYLSPRDEPVGVWDVTG